MEWGGYNGNQRYHDAGSGSASGTWELSGLAAGDYEVDATWVEGSAEATSAPWKIYDGNTLLSTVQVNNTQAPVGTVVNGRPFQNLATVHITSGTLKVVASETPTGQVAVDAVRIVFVAPAPPPTADLNWSNGGLSNVPSSVTTQTTFTVNRSYTVAGTNLSASFAIAYYASTDQTFGNGDDQLLATETVGSAPGWSVGSHNGSSPNLQLNTAGTYYVFARLDSSSGIAETDETNNVVASATTITATGAVVMDSSSSPNYAESGGGWQQWNGGGYNGNQRYHDAGSGSASGTWELSGLAAGDYEVDATWVEGSAEATSAPWKIYDGNTLLSTVQVNNTQAPVGTVVNGRPFQNLATVHITSGTLKVVASETPTGQMAVDAVRIVFVAPAPPPTADLNWSNGGLSNVPPSINSGLHSQSTARMLLREMSSWHRSRLTT